MRPGSTRRFIRQGEVRPGPETAEIWGSWGRLSKAAFKAAARSDCEDTEKIRKILERARKELEAL